MARESYESKQRRAARQTDALASGVWIAKATHEVAALPSGTVLRIGDDFTTKHGLTEPMLRKLTGLLRMDSTWNDVAPTAHVPSGKQFAGYIWTVR